ncbi:GATA zinc finger domain-containing protein 10-like [Drosophila busckii]|uniref:GATA zinc finger domain-containing protein 10-like n=1 Tax=Drosophila busckii TaxID=30019 RepID=UPI001433226A|nr:GATA zinc finger domain-containing protein 10-like [Drosophila busckii]
MARTNIDVDLQSLSSEQRQLNAIASIEDIYKTYKSDYVVQSASSTTLKKAELTQDYKDNASQLSDTQTLQSETNYEELCSTSSTLQLEEQQKFKEPQQKMENNGETSVPEHLAGNFCNFRIASGQGPDKQNTNDASPEEYQCNNNCCKCEQMQMPNAKNNVRFADNCNQGSSSSNNNSNCSSNSNMYPMDATQYYQQLQMQGLNANNYDYFGYGMAPPGAESAYPCQYPQMQQQQQQQQQQDYRNYAPSYQMPNTNFENCMSNGSYAPASLQAGQQCSNEEISSQCSEQAAAQCCCNNSQHSELSQQKSDSSEAHSMHEVNSQRGFEMPEGADCISHMLPNPLTEMTQMSRPINMGMGMGMGSCSCSFEPTQANMGSCMSCAAPQQGAAANCLDIEAFMLQQQQQQQPQQQQQQHCYSNPITVPSQMQSQGMPCNLQMPGNYAPASGMAPVPVPSCFMPMTMPTPCGMPCCNPNQGAANDKLANSNGLHHRLSSFQQRWQ